MATPSSSLYLYNTRSKKAAEEKAEESSPSSDGQGGLKDFNLPDRGRTAMGPQGEHASAYVLFEELAYSSCFDETPDNALSNLIDNFSCLRLSQDEMDSLTQIAAQIYEMDTTCLVRGKRKNVTKTLRGADYLLPIKDEILKILEESGKANKELIEQARKGFERISLIGPEDRSKVKESILEFNRFKFSSLVSKLINECVFKANKIRNVSFPKEGGFNDEDKEAEVEKNREKTAKNALKTLSTLIRELDQIKELSEQEKSDFIDDVDLLKKISVWGIGQEELGGLVFLNEKIEDVLRKKGTLEKISEYINHLFFYPSIDDDKLIPCETPAEIAAWEITRQERRYNKGTQPRNNELDILYKLTTRHIVLIFNAFKGLSQGLDPETQEKIVKDFVNKLIEKQKWKKSGMDLNKFFNNLEQYAVLDYESANFYMNDSPKYKKIESKVKNT